MNETILVVAAHADDEALGCGGTIARHVAEGDEVYAAFLADGVSSRRESTEEEVVRRNQIAEQARHILGIKQNIMLGFPDNRLDSIPLLDVVQKLEEVIGQLKPTVVYTHHPGDLNVDHRVTHQALMTACRPLPGSSIKRMFAFEVLSATEWNTPGLVPFNPNYFVDITEFLKIKLSAIDAYSPEMRSSPHSRSKENIENLARYRGHCVGMFSAEAFTLLRQIV